MTHQLIEQLRLYKQVKGKSYDNDYASILYWVTEILPESEISEDKESVLEFTCRGYHCVFFKEQDKYFLY